MHTVRRLFLSLRNFCLFVINFYYKQRCCIIRYWESLAKESRRSMHSLRDGVCLGKCYLVFFLLLFSHCPASNNGFPSVTKSFGFPQAMLIRKLVVKWELNYLMESTTLIMYTLFLRNDAKQKIQQDKIPPGRNQNTWKQLSTERKEICSTLIISIKR